MAVVSVVGCPPISVNVSPEILVNGWPYRRLCRTGVAVNLVVDPVCTVFSYVWPCCRVIGLPPFPLLPLYQLALKLEEWVCRVRRCSLCISVVVRERLLTTSLRDGKGGGGGGGSTTSSSGGSGGTGGSGVVIIEKAAKKKGGTCGSVTGSSGLGIGWNAAATMAEGLLANPGERDYKLQNVPSDLIGGTYFGTKTWPSAGTWKIEYTAPVTLYVWVMKNSYNAGVDAALGGDGWEQVHAPNFKRSDNHALNVWKRFFADGSSYDIQTTALMVGGVVSNGCEATCSGSKTNGDCDEINSEDTCNNSYMKHHGIYVQCEWKTNNQCLSKVNCPKP
ncbi:unnamed protein product [Symbiodinium natans]|uniref:Uncharacterized protein n=1 Tax=Symbiodinium natans TaxID=878477 RepID=A0A812R700_9DINO|nr:unnamed protein product [Symbiodinium natans]